MIPEQRKRAGDAVLLRLAQLHMSVPKLAERSGVSAATLRALIRGERWPNSHTRERINHALGWPPGELAQRAVVEHVCTLDMFTFDEILAEIGKRYAALTTET